MGENDLAEMMILIKTFAFGMEGFSIDRLGFCRWIEKVFDAGNRTPWHGGRFHQIQVIDEVKKQISRRVADRCAKFLIESLACFRAKRAIIVHYNDNRKSQRAMLISRQFFLVAMNKRKDRTVTARDP